MDPTGISSAEGCGSVSGEVAPPPVWRPERPPYQWAPLGTVPADYPQPDHPPPGSRLFDEETAATAGQPDPNLPADRRSAGTKRAQAVSIIVNKFLDIGSAPTQGGERPHLLVTVSEESLRQRIGSGRLGYGDRVPIEQVRMLACDSQVVPAVLGGKSEVLDMGRAMRSFNAACRKAILLRDKGCVFYGCDLPGKWCENHHVRHWADGGPSDYGNGVLLCRRHHTLVHQGQWQVRVAADGAPEIIPPVTHDLEQRPLRNTLHDPPRFAWRETG